ncbi:hypothetical protein [Methylobacter sp.]|uniref:hypothetical protein n=1 Tax=Methylobacter sp. TaxID=2051955 RepID=UPI0024870A90|nr:hypothetical protein [Methylobacter sp.]MDI1276339.1 hypothetical protein [Methylobacter sp.]MDI1357079.1 hypothetical protein [Methylobacter sp.]
MTDLKRKCAYCGEFGNLSREHIFPSSIIQRSDEKLMSLNDKSDSYFKSDLVVKDVCENCNNGVLSNLDNQLCIVYDSCMHSPVMPGADAELSYDYHPLLRVLLKISFNSARASSDGIRAVKAFRNLVPYIMGKTETAPDVMLRLQIDTSAKKYNIENQQVEGLLKANILRSAKLAYDGPQKSRFIVRLVAINSFWFYLILPTQTVDRAKKQAFLKGFKAWQLQPGLEVLPNQSSLNIPAEKTTYIHPSLLSGMKRKN